MQHVFDIIVFEKPTDQKIFVNYVYFDNKQNAAIIKTFQLLKNLLIVLLWLKTTFKFLS